MRRLLPLFLPLLAACPPKQIPLEAQRIQLEQLDRLAMPEGWQPQATIVLSESVVQTLVDRGVDASRGQIPPIMLEGPLGIRVAAQPRPNSPEVHLREADCPSCVGADVDWTGSLGIQLGIVNGSVGWKSSTSATVRVDGRPTPDGFGVTVQPVDKANWATNLDVVGLPNEYDSVVSRTLKQRLAREADDGPFGRPIPVATLPGDGLVRLRALSGRVDGGLAIDLGFSTLRAGAVAQAPDPGNGFAVALPADTIVGIANAALLRMGPQHGFLAEPYAMHIEDGEFDLWVKVWKVSSNPKYKDFVVRGTIGRNAETGGLSVVTTSATETESLGSMGVMDGVIRGILTDVLRKSLAVQSPGQYVQTVGTSSLTVDVTRVDADDDLLTIYGTVK